MITYSQAISIGFSNVTFSAVGAGNVYEEITWIDGDIPTQEELDTFIVQYTKDQMWELIKDERDRRKIDGGYKVGSDWFHSDTYSRTQQLGLVMLGGSLPGGIMWKTMSGSFVLMTPTLAGQIFQAAMMSDVALHSVAEQKRVAMLASESPGEYSWQTGWPLMYGE